MTNLSKPISGPMLGLFCATLLGGATTLAHADDSTRGDRLDARGDRIEQRLDNRGDRREEKLDNKGDRVNDRLDRKGDRINDRLDRRGERASGHRH